MQKTETHSPIFVIGSPRSGTSIINWAIGQHPNIQVMPETAWIADYVTGAFAAYHRGSARGEYSHLSNVGYPLAEFLSAVATSINTIVMEAYERRCYFLYGNYEKNGIEVDLASPEAHFQVRRSPADPKTRWIDSTPLNTHYVWALAQVFPQAKFIHNLRQPADVASSLQKFDALGVEASEVDEGLSVWIQHTETALLAEKALGSARVLRVLYERIEKEPELLFQEIMSFLGEPYCSDCLLPLGTKVNSSAVGKSNPDLLASISDLNIFHQATQLYERAVHDAVTTQKEAVALLSSKFESYWREKFKH